MAKPSKFRNPQNIRYTRALFIDAHEGEDKSTCLYTLTGEGSEQYPSLYRLYLDMEDPTEWEFAETYFEDYEHWMKIAESPWAKEHVERWRTELDLKIRAQALKRVRKIAESDTKDSLAANRYLLDKGWVVNPDGSRGTPRKRGRPSKEAIRKEAEALFKAEKEYEEDYNRLVLNETTH